MSARYDQCDATCTTDCGHCKGAGRPKPRVCRICGEPARLYISGAWCDTHLPLSGRKWT